MRKGLSVWITGVLVLASADFLMAQESVTQETNAPSVKWYQINTPNFKILYPKGFEIQAQRMANTMEQIRTPEASSMGVRPKKIPIILQNQSAYSNAFVTLAPRRSEFYTMAPQDYNFGGNNDWLSFLASHEYRHIAQFQRSKTGFTWLASGLFGQQTQAVLAYAAVPPWFWEGDAVATETAFTHSGRGRIPNFNLLLRTNLLEGRSFNYHKQFLRSYKHNIPDHYVLGYNMVSYLRKKTGDRDIWERIAKRSWGLPFIPFTFSNAIKHETGHYVVDLYNEMASGLITEWKKELEGLAITSFVPVNKRSTAAYTDYLYPQPRPDGSVVVQKSGIGDIERLVVLRDGEEEKVYVEGPVNKSGVLSAVSGRIVWNEYRFDPRWLVRNYSVIKGYDLESGKAKTLSARSRYASAALSPDGSKVATIESTTDYQTRLVILDYDGGAVLKKIENPGNDFISMPRWTDDGKYIVALKFNKAGKTITRFDVETGSAVDLLPAGDENLGYPVPFSHYIFYNSPYSGIDNIYVLDTNNGQRFQVTCSRYGSYNPALTKDGSMLYYNEQSRNGMDVVKVPVDPASWRPLGQIKRGTGFYQHLVDQEGRPGLFDSVAAKSFPTRRYHRSAGMINPHSWGPYFTNTLTQANAGIYSQDILSTNSVNAGYLYDINEKTGSWHAGVSYQGFYPIVDVQVFSGSREDKTTAGDRDVKLDWDETGVTGGLRIPLQLTRSKYNTQIEIGNSVSLTQIDYFHSTVTKGDTLITKGKQRYVPVTINYNGAPAKVYYLLSDQVNDGTLLSNYFTFTYAHVLKQSRRDFNPAFAQYLYFDHYSTPYGGDFYGRQWTASGLAFFPGPIKHHSLYFRGGYQNAYSSPDLDTYTFRNRLFKPRGYGYPNDHTFYTVSSNYQFPVWYPDIAAGPVLNLQRIKANLFYDYGHGEGTNFFHDFAHNDILASHRSVNYLSTGVEVTFDINVMRLLQQVEVGFRVTRINANAYYNSGVVWELLIGNIPF